MKNVIKTFRMVIIKIEEVLVSFGTNSPNFGEFTQVNILVKLAPCDYLYHRMFIEELSQTGNNTKP